MQAQGFINSNISNGHQNYDADTYSLLCQSWKEKGSSEEKVAE
jgi:hypothetical protein